ncbi:hypothetical protein ACER0C_005412 [Sarotherodon galilaeus]
MKENLEHFVGSREVPQEDIIHMQQDKLVAVKSFCQQTKYSTYKETLLQNLRNKIAARKVRSKTKGALCGHLPSGVFHKQGEGMARQRNTAGEKTCRKTEIGWLHLSSNEYHQVRTRNGGGIRHATVEKTTTVAQILEMERTWRVEDFIIDVCNFKRNPIPLDETSSSDEDFSFSITEEDSQVTLLGSDSETDDFVPDLVDHGDSSDSDTGEQIHNFQIEPKPEKLKSLCEAVTTQSPGKSHHMHSTPTEIKNTSQHKLPKDLEVRLPDTDEADTVIWNPEEDLVRADGDDTVVITLNYINSEDLTHGQLWNADLNGLPMDGFLLPLSSANGLLTPHMQSIHEEAPQIAHRTVTVLSCTQDHGLNFIAQGLPFDSSNHLSPSTSGNPQSPCVSIRRTKVVDDLLAVFMDSSITNVTLKMNFVNENAVDDAGVSREVYIAFWEQFLERCEGETERVPRLRPAFCDAEWQAVGQIWVKCLLDHGVFPVRLSKAFILACIHGMDSVDVDIMITSFLNYLLPVERSAVEKALQGTMDENDEEDQLDLFTRMGSHFLPPKNNMQPAIETMAHKAILQESKYIMDCFSTPMAYTKKATGKRVVDLTSRVPKSSHSSLQRYVKNDDEKNPEKILRFCTGSFVICVDKILVCFNAETGLNRRPVTHTCGATLEVPCTYSSYPEFRTEFDNVLSSNYFEMDII